MAFCNFADIAGPRMSEQQLAGLAAHAGLLPFHLGAELRQDRSEQDVARLVEVG